MVDDLRQPNSDDADAKSVELSMRRTGMSIQRTRMSADRTLMSIMRTSLSLIAFGFTLYEAFKKALDAGAIHSVQSPRNFGLALIGLGILLLIGGIARHVQFARELRERRGALIEEDLVHGDSAYPYSVTLFGSVILLVIGILAVVSIVFDVSFLGL